jgi:hypothetical protein
MTSRMGVLVHFRVIADVQVLISGDDFFSLGAFLITQGRDQSD